MKFSYTISHLWKKCSSSPCPLCHQPDQNLIYILNNCKVTLDFQHVTVDTIGFSGNGQYHPRSSAFLNLHDYGSVWWLFIFNLRCSYRPKAGHQCGKTVNDQKTLTLVELMTKIREAGTHPLCSWRRQDRIQRHPKHVWSPWHPQTTPFCTLQTDTSHRIASQPKTIWDLAF